MTKRFKAFTRQEHIKNTKLAEFATPYPKTPEEEKRKIAEKQCEFRNAFIRDRDRIVHSASFRRLQDKTQIFISGLSPLFRNRLTHTLEVWQISVSIARMLRANVHLTEAIALGHDLGHTPFGHAGEIALDNIMVENRLEGFSHNEQSVRVISLLESEPNIIPLDPNKKIPLWPDSVGLNLTYTAREGIFKHTDRFKSIAKDKNILDEFGKSDGTIEAQIVNISDDIAQHTHGLHDIWMAGAISREDTLAIFADFPQFLGNRIFGGEKADISSIIGELIYDVVKKSLENLNDKYNGDPRKRKFIMYSEDGMTFSENLEELINEKAILGDEVNQMNSRGRHIIHSLFDMFIKDPYCLPANIKNMLQPDIREKLQNPKGYEKTVIKYHEDIRVVCDHIASLTDQEAIDTFRSTLI